jgi:ubiquinone/menaquinone biosynthesis C-methylase UbiE
MMNLLQEIRSDGFDSAMARLQSREPGVFQFILDPARSDWRYGTVLHPTDRVLDVGCGLGGNTFGLCDQVESVVAFDLSLARVRFVRERAKHEGKTNIQSFVGDFMSLPLPEQSFDVIVFNGILEWVGQSELFSDPYEVQKWVMKKCFRLLRPGGRMYVGIENRFSYSYLYPGLDHIGLRCTSWMPRWFARPYCKFRIGKDYRTYTHGKPGYERLFREAGFTSIRVMMPFPGYNDQRLLIPFDDVACLRYAIASLMGNLNWKKRCVKWLSRIPGVLQIYRYFFFSYNIYGLKSHVYDSAS